MEKEALNELKKEVAGKINDLFDYMLNNNLNISFDRYGGVYITYQDEICVKVVDKETRETVEELPPFCECSLVRVKH